MTTIAVSVSVRGSDETYLSLPETATIADALDLLGLGLGLGGDAVVGVWGRVRALTHSLRDGDRVEIYAPLNRDPKDARRAKAPTRRKK